MGQSSEELKTRFRLFAEHHNAWIAAGKPPKSAEALEYKIDEVAKRWFSNRSRSELSFSDIAMITGQDYRTWLVWHCYIHQPPKGVFWKQPLSSWSQGPLGPAMCQFLLSLNDNGKAEIDGRTWKEFRDRFPLLSSVMVIGAGRQEGENKLVIEALELRMKIRDNRHQKGDQREPEIRSGYCSRVKLGDIFPS